MHPVRLTLAVPFALVMTLGLAVGAPTAGAADTTSVGVTAAAVSGLRVDVAGTLALGADAGAPAVIADDGSGDATVPKVGLDLGRITVTADPAAKRLTYTINTFDMPSAPASQGPPFYGYLAPIAVNGDDSHGYFLAAGFAGANFPPSTGKFWQLCTSVNGSYQCTNPLTGTMGDNVITLQVPYSRIGIGPGGTLDPGASLVCPGVCSTIWAVALENDTGGDDVATSAYQVPGGVRLGIAPEGTPLELIDTDTPATVKADGTWTGSLERPATSGTYTVVARSCWGSADEPSCVESTSTVTV